MLATAPLFCPENSQVLFAGDSGQLALFATVGINRWQCLTWPRRYGAGCIE
ncbi:MULTISPECIES: hypothetical protein [unclassified Streptomyces]|uniref:hypothetical protein n=1 Tax=unclassified Streptomyces TaxID=2593676 RepID=UPI0034340184